MTVNGVQDNYLNFTNITNTALVLSCAVLLIIEVGTQLYGGMYLPVNTLPEILILSSSVLIPATLGVMAFCLYNVITNLRKKARIYLPQEMIFHILRFLPARDMGTVMRLNRAINLEFTSDNNLWERICLQRGISLRAEATWLQTAKFYARNKQIINEREYKLHSYDQENVVKTIKYKGYFVHSSDNQIVIRDLTTGKRLYDKEHPDIKAEVNTQNGFLVIYTLSEVEVWHLVDNRPKRCLYINIDYNSIIHSASIDENKILKIETDSNVQLYDIETKEILSFPKDDFIRYLVHKSRIVVFCQSKVLLYDFEEKKLLGVYSKDTLVEIVGSFLKICKKSPSFTLWKTSMSTPIVEDLDNAELTITESPSIFIIDTIIETITDEDNKRLDIRDNKSNQHLDFIYLNESSSYVIIDDLVITYEKNLISKQTELKIRDPFNNAWICEPIAMESSKPKIVKRLDHLNLLVVLEESTGTVINLNNLTYSKFNYENFKEVIFNEDEVIFIWEKHFYIFNLKSLKFTVNKTNFNKLIKSKDESTFVFFQTNTILFYSLKDKTFTKRLNPKSNHSFMFTSNDIAVREFYNYRYGPQPSSVIIYNLKTKKHKRINNYGVRINFCFQHGNYLIIGNKKSYGWKEIYYIPTLKRINSRGSDGYFDHTSERSEIYIWNNKLITSAGPSVRIRDYEPVASD